MEFLPKMPSEPETLTCYCLKCKWKLGSFQNTWDRLGKTYFIPRVTISTTGLKGAGPIKLANSATQIGTVVENRYINILS